MILRVAILASAVVALAAPPAGAQPVHIVGAKYEPSLAVTLDGGGGSRLEEDTRGFRLYGAAGVGAHAFNGSTLWTATADIAGLRNDRISVGLTLSRQAIESGLGLFASGLYDLTRGAPGVGGGVSFSVLHLAVSHVLADDPATVVAAFLRVPVGFIAGLLLRAR